MNQIRKLRALAGMSQVELAERLFVSQSAVSSWEVGRTEPDYKTLKKISELLQVSIDEIIGNAAPEAKKEKPAETGELHTLDISSLTPENRWRMEDYLRLLLTSQNKP